MHSLVRALYFYRTLSYRLVISSAMANDFANIYASSAELTSHLYKDVLEQTKFPKGTFLPSISILN